jgi:hypothetical protein
LFFSKPVCAQVPIPHLLGENIVSECDYCGCAQGISPIQTGSTGIRYDFGSLSLATPYNGSLRQPNPENANESFLTSKLTFFYRFAESPITISLSVPYVSRRAEEPGDDGSGLATSKADGIGDISAILRYNRKEYIGEATVAYSFSAGIKFATGASTIMTNDTTYLDPDLQPGTGSTDIILGTAGFWSRDRLGFFGSLNVGIVTGGGAPGPDGIHKYGNYILADITTAYRIIPAEASMSNLSISLGIGIDAREKETEGGVPITASGGYLIYVAPGLKYLISESMAADALIQIPVHQYLGWDPQSGDNQLGQAYRMLFGLQYSF